LVRNLGGEKMVIADLNVGILYTFGIVSLGVYGIVLAGYASNSKYPFLGGIRSSAQMISYEIAMGMSVIPVFLIVGDLNLSKVIEYQAQHGWLILYAPLSFVILSFRLRRDQPAAVRPAGIGAGTGGRLSYRIQFDEIRAFLHGRIRQHDRGLGHDGHVVFGRLDAALRRLGQAGDSIPMGVAHIVIFMAKVAVLMGMFIWVRWMWPRFRYDQLMDLGWRRFLPLALANILATALWLWMVV
jgi:NADH-quinone oxidoreductase subunit H